jgi:hypothetical protein
MQWCESTEGSLYFHAAAVMHENGFMRQINVRIANSLHEQSDMSLLRGESITGRLHERRIVANRSSNVQLRITLVQSLPLAASLMTIRHRPLNLVCNSHAVVMIRIQPLHNTWYTPAMPPSSTMQQ